VHKTANILDKMPKSVQGKAKQLIHEMYLAPTRKAALADVLSVFKGLFMQSICS
jgi:transposase-like protein